MKKFLAIVLTVFLGTFLVVYLKFSPNLINPLTTNRTNQMNLDLIDQNHLNITINYPQELDFLAGKRSTISEKRR